MMIPSIVDLMALPAESWPIEPLRSQQLVCTPACLLIRRAGNVEVSQHNTAGRVLKG